MLRLQRAGEFWFRLNALHCLTSQGQWELRIDLKLTNGTLIYLPYNKFAVGPATEQYPLTISGFSGYTTDPFNLHQSPPTSHAFALNKMKFTTIDKDNDRWSRNCANPTEHSGITGGWWYNRCAEIYPNNQYKHVYVIALNGWYHSPSFIEIKIRSKTCT